MSSENNAAGTVLAISSHVARGVVGNSAAVPALMRLGIEVWPVPTVIWSNHPGHGAPAGPVMTADDLDAIIGRLAESGGLERCAAVLTGYFADPAQVAAAARAIDLARSANPQAVVCCDPIMGDDPGGLYVAEPVAEAIRDMLVARADLVTPNRFELGWLTGREIAGLEDAIEAARVLAPATTLATSLPGRTGHIMTAHMAARRCHSVETRARTDVPHGVGDLLTAFFVGHRLQQCDAAAALGLAAAWIERVLDAGGSHDELSLDDVLAGARTPAPLRITTVE